MSPHALPPSDTWSYLLHSNLFNVLLVAGVLGWVLGKINLPALLDADTDAVAAELNEATAMQAEAQQKLTALRQRIAEFDAQAATLQAHTEAQIEHATQHQQKMAHERLAQLELHTQREEAQLRYQHAHQLRQACTAALVSQLQHTALAQLTPEAADTLAHWGISELEALPTVPHSGVANPLGGVALLRLKKKEKTLVKAFAKGVMPMLATAERQALWLQVLALLVSSLHQSESLKHYFEAESSVAVEQQKTLVQESLATVAGINDLKPALDLLIEAGLMHLPLLEAVHELCSRLYEGLQNQAQLTLRTGKPLAPQQLERLEQWACRYWGLASVTLAVQTDATLLAGFVLSAKGFRFDASLKTRLSQYTHTLLQAS
jgi:F0F1-type ATP synthase delta subunit/F0F1-type ATP synthase membrane subunit b/b'